MSKIDEIEKRHNDMSIYIDAQISNLSAHSLYIQKRYVESLRCSFEALCKYSLIETYKDSPNCINVCLFNLASVLKDIRLSKDATVEIKTFNDVINRFRSTPPRFSTPTTNKNIQWLFVFISNRQKDIYNALPEEQWLELDAFIKNINSNTQ